MIKKNILITGGLGFIGINAVEYFYKKNFNILIVDNLSRSGSLKNLNLLKKKKIKFIFFKLDLINFKEILSLVKKYKPNLILHLAAQTAVTLSILNPRQDFNDNVIGSFNLLEACRIGSNKSVIIYSSTNKVYGTLNLPTVEGPYRYFFKKLPKNINENVNLNFVSPYGCSKGSADQYFIDYAKIYKLKTVVLRQSCIYGLNQRGAEDQGWISHLLKQAMNGDQIKIFGNGKQVRDLLYCNDLIELYSKIYSNIEKCKSQCFNIGGGFKNSLSIIEFLKFIRIEFKLKFKIKFLKKPRYGDQKIFISNNSKIFNFVKWKPKTSYQKGLKYLFKSYNHINF